MSSIRLTWPAAVACAVLLVAAGMFVQWALVGRRGAPPNARRSLTNALWGPPRESYIHATIQIQADEALRYLKEVTARTGITVTLTHLVGKALGQALHKVPELNRTLVWNRFIEHESHEISFLVALDNGRDTGWLKMDVDETKTVTAIAEELREGGLELRREPKSQSLAMTLMPAWILRLLTNVTSFFAAGLGVSFGALGIDRYPFGRIIVINSSSFGIESGYISRTAFARVPMNVLICKVIPTTVVEGGEVVVRQCFNLCVNADHRYVDGLQLGRTCSIVRKIFKNPWSLDT